MSLAWNNLAWAMTYRLLRGTTGDAAEAEVLAEIPNTGTCEWLDETGETGAEYWYWVEADVAQDSVTSDPMTGMKKWGWPDAKDEAEVAAALGEAVDVRLGERIKSVAEYDAFRDWVDEKGMEPKTVRDSVYAWPSYVLGAEGLFENEPSITLGGMSVETGGEGQRDAEGTIIKVSVTIRDGEQVVDVDATKVTALFECTSDLADWTGEAALMPTVEEKGVEGEALLFEITPGGGVERAFLRIAE